MSFIPNLFLYFVVFTVCRKFKNIHVKIEKYE